MKYIKKFSIPAILFGFLVFCSPDGLSPDQREYIIPDENISYYDDLQPMLNGKCGWQCHDGSKDIGIINFNDKLAFMEHIIPGTNGKKLLEQNLLPTYQADPLVSPLYQIITQNYEGYDLMPPLPRTPLTQNQINGIVKWIRDGAQDYAQ